MLIDFTGNGSSYTKAEIDSMLATLETPSYEVVSELPVTGDGNIIYLLPTSAGDSYEQWIYTENDGWVKIGETAIELDDYVTDLELGTILEDYQGTLTAGDRISISSSNVISAESQILSLTQAEYDALGTNIDPDMVYVITDASPVVLATVATTGSYNDLTDKPTIPVIPTLATVATTGDYNDLSNTPDIPQMETFENTAYMATYGIVNTWTETDSSTGDEYKFAKAMNVDGDVYILSWDDQNEEWILNPDEEYPVYMLLDDRDLTANVGGSDNIYTVMPGQYAQNDQDFAGFGISNSLDGGDTGARMYLGTDGNAYIQNNTGETDPETGDPILGTAYQVITEEQIGTGLDFTNGMLTATGGGGGSTEEIEQAVAAAINDTRDTINQDLHNNYVRTQTMNDALKPYATKASLDSYYTKAQVDTNIGTVYAEIEDKERTVSYALNDLHTAMDNTVALVFTLDGIGTVTYNVVINE